MKYLLILLLSSTMAFGQNTMSFEIANNPYTYAFDKAKKRFSICTKKGIQDICCLLYTSPSPRDGLLSRMPSSA